MKNEKKKNKCLINTTRMRREVKLTDNKQIKKRERQEFKQTKEKSKEKLINTIQLPKT